MPANSTPRKRIVCTILFTALVLFYVVASFALLRFLPDDMPNGGPDERMHLSTARYIAENFKWPRWDEPTLERYENGTNYATSSSFSYWIEGVLLRSTGHVRLSAFLLFMSYLAFAICCFRKNSLAGLFAIAAITPQTLFVFAYVNSDAWTVIVAMALGFAVSRFQRVPDKTGNLLLLFATAGACISCRFHLWPIGLVAFLYGLLPRLLILLRERRKQLISALALGVAIAAWWPVTSYVANDGDIIGMKAEGWCIEKFGNPNLPSLARPLVEFSFSEFASLTGKSFFGVWGFANFYLATGWYVAAALLGMALLAFFCAQRPRQIPFIVALLVLNAALMVVYSVQSDYQPQGRYLFPWYFITVGFIVEGLVAGNADSARAKSTEPSNQTSAGKLWQVAALVAFSVFNISASLTLWKRVELAEKTDPVDRGYMMYQHGYSSVASRIFQRVLDQHPDNLGALNGLGMVRMNDRDLAGAESLFRQAVQISPGDVQSRMNLGISQYRQEKFAEAAQTYESAAARNPRDIEVHWRLVSAYTKLGNLEKALLHCRRAAQLAPNSRQIQERLKALEQQSAEGKKVGPTEPGAKKN